MNKNQIALQLLKLAEKILAPKDYDTFTKRLLAVAKRRRLSVEVLGEVRGNKIYLLETKRKRGPHILVYAGFHGEELGGLGVFLSSWRSRRSSLRRICPSFRLSISKASSGPIGTTIAIRSTMLPRTMEIL